MSEFLQIYLPVAEVSIDVFLLIAIGIAIGLLAGLFGIGGGIFLVPILIAIGVPSQVAVATSTNQMTAASFSGYLAYSRRNRVDYKLGAAMLIGGVLGAFLGVIIFDYLTEIGYIDIFISLSFMVLLSVIGFTTAKDAVTLLYYKLKRMEIPKSKHDSFFRKINLPYQVHFPSARKEISFFSPILVGFMGGLLVAIMGIGGSLVMIPAMIYILRISEAFTAGTTHFQLIFTTIITTTLHCLTNHNLDIVLSSILIIGTAFGVQVGARLGAKVHPENYRIFLAIMIFLLCIRVAYGLFVTPKSLYTIEYLENV